MYRKGQGRCAHGGGATGPAGWGGHTPGEGSQSSERKGPRTHGAGGRPRCSRQLAGQNPQKPAAAFSVWSAFPWDLQRPTRAQGTEDHVLLWPLLKNANHPKLSLGKSPMSGPSG